MKMKTAFKISYVLTTYNKYAYLKITLPYIVQQLQNGEELIITDGGSNDGTVAFIEALIKDKKNITFISEKDKGESDGLNKALAMCTGEVIKNLTDDDAFSFYATRKAAEHLIVSDLDIMGFDGYGLSLLINKIEFTKSQFTQGFSSYAVEKKPFFFCGLSYLIKRTSLPRLGNFSLDYKMVDLEYSFRISSGTCKIGWSNLLMFTNIYNANSNTLLFNKRLEEESLQLYKKYAPRKQYFRTFYRFKLQRLLELKNRLLKKQQFGTKNELSFEEGFKRSLEVLEKENLLLKEITFFP